MNDSRRSTNKKILIGIGLVIAAIIAVGVIASGGDSAKQAESNPITPTTDLANEVDTQFKKSLGVSSYSASTANFQPVNGFTDTGNGNVDVNYQLDCTKEEAKGLSKQIMTMVGSEIGGLDSITVKCSNGKADFTFRSEVLTD